MQKRMSAHIQHDCSGVFCAAWLLATLGWWLHGLKGGGWDFWGLAFLTTPARASGYPVGAGIGSGAWRSAKRPIALKWLLFFQSMIARAP
jgi:hypothetical protein